MSTWSMLTAVSMASPFWCQCFDFGLTNVLWTPAPKERFLGTRQEEERSTGIRDFLPEPVNDTGELSGLETSSAEAQTVLARSWVVTVLGEEERQIMEARLEAVSPILARERGRLVAG